MAKMIRISKTYTVTVYRFIEVNVDADGDMDENYIAEQLDALEHDANMDLDNIGQEQPFFTDSYREDEDVETDVDMADDENNEDDLGEEK